MKGKARYIFPVMISALIVFVVSGVVTFSNIGMRADLCRAGSRPSPPAGRSPPYSRSSQFHAFAAQPMR
jgi:hypothetical protein